MGSDARDPDERIRRLAASVRVKPSAKSESDGDGRPPGRAASALFGSSGAGVDCDRVTDHGAERGHGRTVAARPANCPDGGPATWNDTREFLRPRSPNAARFRSAYL
ncbi:hypothetical protein JCM2811A_08020 [Methylorubrum rhodinum]